MAAESGILPASAKLCDHCSWEKDNYASTSIVEGDNYKGRCYRKIALVQKAAKDGCWPCGLYLAAIEQLWVPDDPGFMTGQGEFYLRHDTERLTIHGQVKHPTIQIYSAEGQPQAYRFPRAPELPAEAASTKTCEFIKSCLDNCVRNHMSCRKASQGLEEFWPKRILHVDPEKSQVRLVSFDRSMDQQYTALSYCWGAGKPPFQATKHTLPALRRGVSTSILPRTIADAVRFSAQVGCTLIWVDSLCIVQDDSYDWDEEACKMSTVYRRALVTLVASSAASCHDGFLETKRDGSIPLHEPEIPLLPSSPQLEQRIEVRARKLPESGYHHPCSSGRRFDRSPEHRRLEPVDARGWTLQEKQLSPRCVTFTSTEVQWECRAARACECGQAPPEDTTTPKPSPSPSPSLSPQEGEWFRTLEDYTSRRLTVDADRLTALAGVSRSMARTLAPPKGGQQQQQEGQCRFAAGIWVTPEPSPLTARGLLWTRKSSLMAPAYCPREYLAPSWSWASVVGEVGHVGADKFASASSSPCSYPAQILEVDITAATADPFGRLAFGFMRVRGALLRTRLIWAPSARFRDLAARLTAGPAGSCDVDVPLERVPLPGGGGFTVQRRAAASAEEADRLFAITEFPETEVFVLPFLEYVTGYGSRWVECLVLGRSPTLPGYQRLGTTSFSLDHAKLPEDSVPEDICIF